MKHTLDDREIKSFLSHADYQDQLLKLATEIMSSSTAISDEPNVLMLQLASRLAESKQRANKFPRLKLGVVFAMWNEAKRLLPQSSENPLGEDCLRVKFATLKWLFDDTRVSWQIYAVDDGCPNNSYDVASCIAVQAGMGKSCRVLKLAEQIPTSGLPLSAMRTVGQSMKGGSIVLGAQTAISEGCDVVVYTDCDNTVHLGQLGTLIDPMMEGKIRIACGNRRDSPFSYWHGSRSTSQPGYRILRHIQSLLLTAPLLVNDVYSPFKAFEANTLARHLRNVRNFDFTFDFDLAASLTKNHEAVVNLGYIAIDSHQSTSWDSLGEAKIWSQRLVGMVDALRRHGLPHDRQIANLVTTHLHNDESVNKLFRTPPPKQLSSIDKRKIGEPQVMSSDEVCDWVRAQFCS